MKKVLALMLASVFVAPVAGAAEAEPVDEVVVERDGAELRERVAHPDVDAFDTAFVFSNRSPVRAAVMCRGFDHAGSPVGRLRVVVPADGLRFALASDLGDGADFLGRVDCVTGNVRVIGSAFLLGAPGIENVPVTSSTTRRLQTMTIPVTLTR